MAQQGRMRVEWHGHLAECVPSAKMYLVPTSMDVAGNLLEKDCVLSRASPPNEGLVSWIELFQGTRFQIENR